MHRDLLLVEWSRAYPPPHLMPNGESRAEKRFQNPDGGMDADRQGGMNTQRTKRQQVSDELWEAVAPLLPPEPPKPKGGRPPVAPRKALGGILFVLRTGIGSQELTAETGFGSGAGALSAACCRLLAHWDHA